MISVMTKGFTAMLRCCQFLFASAFFSYCSAQEVPDAITAALKRADSAVTTTIAIPDDKRTFDNTIGAIDDLGVRLDTDTSLIIFMQNVSTEAKERDDARAGQEALNNWQIALGKREDLYRAVKAYAATKPKLVGEQARLLEFTLRDYRRSGMELAKEKRDRLQAIEMELGKLGIEFSQNIADDETRVPFTRTELRGVPNDVIDRQIKSAGLLLVGLDAPTFNAVLDYCEVPMTRQKAWIEYKRRGGSKNVRLLERILKLRAEEADLLGYKSVADFETEIRMAKNAATVAKFYTDLRPIVRKKAALDFQQFTAALRSISKDPKAELHPWDYSFVKNTLMRKKYAVDGRKVSEYFPMQRVVDGLFSITQSLYGLTYKDVTAEAKNLGLPIWHPDVKVYEVADKAKGEVLGHFYIDLYPRPNKYSHAACWGLISRKVWPDGTVQKPVAALVCNLTKPTADKPSLLPHDEVETFFHEFGHCLHNILTEAHYGRFAGTAVARDFVEAPSQMFENWVWTPEVLKTFARHYKTDQPLPKALLDGMLKARYLGSGLEAEHQFYYGIVDHRYHTAPGGVVDTTKVGLDTLNEVELYRSIPGSFFQASFDHLIGYQAAYYGYMWSLVYAQDMFQRFEQLGLLNPKAGMYYREKILSRGGTMEEMDMLRDYLGREPKMDAFLRHLGLSEPSTAKATRKEL